jgi:YkoP-like protein
MRSDSGDGHARGVLRVWVWWERSYLRRHHVRRLSDASAVMIEVRTYRGSPVTLRDGTRLQSGDRIIELHLANHAVAGDATSDAWSPFQTLTTTSADLARINRLVQRGSVGPVRALHAVSLIAPALGRLGFMVVPLKDSAGSRLLHFYLVGLLAVYHPQGWRGARRARTRTWPADAWMSVDELARRFGPR